MKSGEREVSGPRPLIGAIYATLAVLVIVWVESTTRLMQNGNHTGTVILGLGLVVIMAVGAIDVVVSLRRPGSPGSRRYVYAVCGLMGCFIFFCLDLLVHG